MFEWCRPVVFDQSIINKLLTHTHWLCLLCVVSTGEEALWCWPVSRCCSGKREWPLWISSVTGTLTWICSGPVTDGSGVKQVCVTSPSDPDQGNSEDTVLSEMSAGLLWSSHESGANERRFPERGTAGNRLWPSCSTPLRCQLSFHQSLPNLVKFLRKWVWEAIK